MDLYLYLLLFRATLGMYFICWRATAAQIIEAVDLTAQPCDDFFQFACGSWNKKHIVPEDKTSYNPFEKLNDELQVILKSKPATAIVCVIVKIHIQRVILGYWQQMYVTGTGK